MDESLPIKGERKTGGMRYRILFGIEYKHISNDDGVIRNGKKDAERMTAK